MELWRKVWREGVEPLLSTEGLLALKQALLSDSPELLQGTTTRPPPLNCVRDWPCEAADAIGYCGWQGDGLETVGEVEEYFARMCYEIDKWVGEPAGCRHFINWWDDTPRHEAASLLCAEVLIALRGRCEPVSSKDALLKAILDDPYDDVSRMALADWLEENGQSYRAMVIRRTAGVRPAMVGSNPNYRFNGVRDNYVVPAGVTHHIPMRIRQRMSDYPMPGRTRGYPTERLAMEALAKAINEWLRDV